MKQLKITLCNTFSTEASDHDINPYSLSGNPPHHLPRASIYMMVSLNGKYCNDIDEGYVIDSCHNFESDEFGGLG